MDKVEEAPGLEDIGNLFLPSTLVSNRGSMKLPAFWPDVAEVWFAQADAQFAIRNISVSKTKFYHMVAVLSQEVASQILDLIRPPPAGDPYKVLREGLITLVSLNKYQQFKALVSLSYLPGPKTLASDELDASSSY